MAKKKTAKKTATKKQTNKSSERTQWDKFPKPNPQDVLRSINMRFGDTGPVIREAKEAWDVSDLRRPSGIVSLDIQTGGGLVAGRVHQFDGPESVGKNYLLYRYFAQAQRIYGEESCLAMACFESFIDKHFAQMCGCQIPMSEYDIEVTQRARAERGEPELTKEEIQEALDCPGVGTFHIFAGTSEKVLDGIIEAVASNIYQIIGIDSWDSMLTAAEEKAQLDEVPQVASPATIPTRWAKKVLDAFNVIYRCPNCGYSPLEKKVTNYELMNFSYNCPHCSWKGLDPAHEINETSVYCIRQVRAKLAMGGKVYGRAYKSDGAYALQHLNHIRVSLHPGSSVKDGNVKIGKEINWEVTKAKAGAREGATGAYTLFFDPLEVDVSSDMFAQCVKHGVIRSLPQGWFEVPDILLEDDKPIRIHGKDKAIQEIENEPELFEELRHLLYIKAGLAHVRFK